VPSGVPSRISTVARLPRGLPVTWSWVQRMPPRMLAPNWVPCRSPVDRSVIEPRPVLKSSIGSTCADASTGATNASAEAVRIQNHERVALCSLLTHEVLRSDERPPVGAVARFPAIQLLVEIARAIPRGDEENEGEDFGFSAHTYRRGTGGKQLTLYGMRRTQRSGRV